MKKVTKRQLLVIAASSSLGVAALGGAAIAGVATPAGVASAFAALPAPFGVTAAHLGAGGPMLEAAVAYIGITREQLRAEVEAGKTLAEIAVANGKTREGLVAAMTAAGQAEVAERVERIVDADPPLKGHHAQKAFFGDLMGAALAYLGITPAEYRTELQAGNSLAEIAVAKGLTRDGVIAAMTAAGNAAIDEAQAAGRLTAEQAADARTRLAEKVTHLADAERPLVQRFRGPGPRGGIGFGL